MIEMVEKTASEILTEIVRARQNLKKLEKRYIEISDMENENEKSD